MTDRHHETLDFGLIREPFDSLLVSMENKVARECPAEVEGIPGARVLLLAQIKITNNMCRSIRYLCADKPVDPTRRREFTLAVPPMTRTIADSVCSLVFLFNDLSNNVRWYWKAGWREIKEEYDRYLTAHGADPAWTNLLTGLNQVLGMMKNSYFVTADEEANPRKILRWPIPNRMLGDANLSAERKTFISYVNDWYYRELSSAAHLSAPGLMNGAGFFFEDDPDVREENLERFRANNVGTALALTVALASEVELELRFGLAEKAKYVWTVLKEYSGAVGELYSSRYEALL